MYSVVKANFWPLKLQQTRPQSFSKRKNLGSEDEVKVCDHSRNTITYHNALCLSLQNFA